MIKFKVGRGGANFVDSLSNDSNSENREASYIYDFFSKNCEIQQVQQQAALQQDVYQRFLDSMAKTKKLREEKNLCYPNPHETPLPHQPVPAASHSAACSMCYRSKTERVRRDGTAQCGSSGARVSRSSPEALHPLVTKTTYNEEQQVTSHVAQSVMSYTIPSQQVK